MNVLIRVEAPAVNEVKGVEVVSAKHLKTKTNLEIHMTEEDRAKTDYQGGLTRDMELMDLSGQPIASYSVMVEGAPAFGRLFNRAIIAMSKLGIAVEEVDWEAEAGVVSISIKDGTGNDLPYLVEVVQRLALRATQAVSHTHHPLTLFDLKQTIGHVYDLKKEVEGAQDLEDWFNVRELVILEEIKEAKAKAKAATKAKAKAAKAEDKPKAKPKAKAKAKPKTKATEGNAASLANLE